MPGILEALSGLLPRWPVRHDEAKASRVGGLVSFSGPGEPVWSPRDYSTFAREGFAQNAIVYRSVRMISEAAASIPLMLFEGDQEHDVHPFLELLSQPCPGSTGTDLLESFYGHLLVAGNAYIEAVGLDGDLRELHALRPDRMKVIPGVDGWPEGYEYTVGGNSVRFSGEVAAGVRPVLHMRLFHPLNDHYGMSPIEAAATAIDIHNEAANWNKALLDNAARPSGALVYAARDAHLTGEQYDRLKSELEAGFAGARNAGRPLLLEGGLDWKPLSLSPKEMDFIETKNAAAREIALAMGVPPMLLGIPGDNTYSNYQEANRSFWRQTVLPLTNRTAKALSRWLSPAFGSETLTLRPDLDQIEALSSEREALWARIEKASFLTRDEKRAAAGYDALGEDENNLGPFPEASQEAKRYDPSQPRAPEGSPNGGKWVGDGGSGGGASGGDDKPVRVAQARRPTRTDAGSPGGRPSTELVFARSRVENALKRVRELDPNFRYTPSITSANESEQVAVARLRAIAQEAEARITFIERGGVPYVFRNMQEYQDFGRRVRTEFESAGHRDAVPHLRGSALTGRSFQEGRPFDQGPKPSDLDLAIVSQTLMRRADELRIPLRNNRMRSVSLNENNLGRLGILSNVDRQSIQQGRDVTIMLYRSEGAITRRGPNIRLQRVEE